MKKMFFLSALLCCMAALTASAGPMEVQASQTNVTVQFYTPSIVRVTKVPVGKSCRRDKPVVIARPDDVSLTRTANTLRSSALTVKVDARTGSVEFLTAKSQDIYADAKVIEERYQENKAEANFEGACRGVDE